MTEQQYRVIADATMNDLRTGDLAVVRVAEGFDDGAWSAEPGLVRIERPVPTADEPKPGPGVRDYERIMRQTAPHPPTPEQIAEVDIAAVEEMGGCVLPTEIGMRAAFEWLAQQEGVRPDWYAEEVPAILAGIDAARRLLALIQNGADR